MLQWDSTYRDNTPLNEEYGSMSGKALVTDAHDLETEVYNRCIGTKEVLDEGTNNGGNIANVKHSNCEVKGN